MEEFVEVQLMRKGKGRLETARKTERAGRPTKRTYLFRGYIRCGICSRKMEGSPRKHGMYYRCPARTLAPGSAALAEHPPTVYVREDPIRDALNAWLGSLFAGENLDRTVRALVESAGGRSGSGDHGHAATRLAAANGQLKRFQAAIAAGVDPAGLVEAINAAQAERAAAQAELVNAQPQDAVTEAEVYAMIDSLGDVGAALAGASREALADLYAKLRLELRYDNEKEAVDVTASPRVNSACVRGGLEPPPP
ncbi:zinc ribbon domain-containing protein [Actinokineospora soli]|uniref:Zinc ribbon domain-containing protein n=1 Tax=Actinokineospora soli TaxID=1048753 RepID=A0ABW2TNH3_9PSEU